MEFKSLKNIETSFRQIRLFCIILVIGCAVVAICSVVFAFRFAEKQREKIYVLDGGKSLMLALDRKQRLPPILLCVMCYVQCISPYIRPLFCCLL